MHQKRSELQIGKEKNDLFSDFNSIEHVFLLPTHQKHLQIQTQNQTIPHEPQNHLDSTQHPSSMDSISSTPTHQYFRQTQFQSEPICNNPSTNNKTLLSTPQKRPIMSQTSSVLSHSPTFSSLQHHCHTATVLSSEPSRQLFLCFSSFSVAAFTTKAITSRVSRYIRRLRWVGAHFRCITILLISLPFLYFFTSKQGDTSFLRVLSILAFSATLVISLIARSSPVNLSSISTASKPRPPVVWSIGPKTKSKKTPQSGSSVQLYSNGDFYEGEFYKGKCSGSGVYYYYMSGRYEGDWVNDKYDGYGVETWAKGSRYRGQYQQGLRHGFGVYRFYTGDVYAGEWCNGQCHGCGVYTCENGSQFVGEFKWGVKHGLGRYHFRNKDKYAGEYFADKMHGFGVYHFGNGHRYEGAWHEGRRQGVGMYTFRNGDTQSGHWNDGVLNMLSIQGTISGSSLAITNSNDTDAVQEARRAAEKAVNMGKVDERVNKAVAAANKAANAARVAAVKAVQNQMHHNNYDHDFPVRIV
ncbi:hypothetical protein U1Q18_019237 [Sarracenia purpurea var. burkii]